MLFRFFSPWGTVSASRDSDLFPFMKALQIREDHGIKLAGW